MRVTAYVYDSETADPHVETVLDRIREREEADEAELFDLAAAEDRDDARREAMLRVRDAVRIGTNPEGIYDESGDPDFSAGALITEELTGRRSLHVGREALDALADEGE